MEPQELHITSPEETRMGLAPSDHALPRELAARDAEISALRETLDRFYDHVVHSNHQLQARLRDLEAQVAALEAERAAQGRIAPSASVPTSPANKAIAYRKLITRIRRVASEALPANATVLVISRGDEAFLKLGGRQGRHFPQRQDGVYAGYYPAESAEAIAHLETLRAQGAEYLLIPSTSLWWLDHYKDFARHLQNQYNVTVRQNDTCWIIDLEREKKAGSQQSIVSMSEEKGYQELSAQIEALVSILLPPDDTALVVSKGDKALLQRCGENAQHFPQGEDGAYAGYHPADSEEAIAHLEALRQQGAAYLLFPSTAFWWLEYYRAFKEHLERHYQVVCRQQHVCLIFALERRFSNNGHTRTGRP